MTKKLKFLAIVTIIFVALLFPTVLHAQSRQLPPGYLRVGLGSSAELIESRSPALDVFISAGSEFLNMGTITGADTFRLHADNYYYVFSGFVFDGVSAALTQAAPPNRIAALSGGMWAVYAGPFTSEAEALSLTGASFGDLRAPTGNRIALYSGWQRIAVFDNDLHISFFADSRGDMVTINGYDYRGYLAAHRIGSNVVPVNVVHLEDYLLSVVPSEMPASWPLHALKAQAVAARSYTHTTMGAHEERGYDLCAAVCCQVYLGIRQEYERSTEAVRATRGMVALHNGEVINAVYSSSSGGITDNSENVWQEALPYLRSVADPYDVTGREWSRTFTRTQLTHIAAANDAGIGTVQSVRIEPSQTGRVQRLILVGDSGQIALEREAIRTFFAPSPGGSLYSRVFRIDSFNVSGGGGSGITTTPPPQGTGANVFVTNGSTPQIQNMSGLRFLDRDGTLASITSGNIHVQTADGLRVLSPMGIGVGAGATTGTSTPVNIAQNVQISGELSSSNYSITFIGRGWGHGVGMSQHGARGMAYAGHTFEQILMHYFRGITLGVREDFE